MILKELPADDFGHEFEAGLTSAEAGEIPEALISADDMARSVFVAGKISGAALWLVDNMGRENAEHALRVAFELVQAHAAKCENEKGH